jgi:hypothetical protein
MRELLTYTFSKGYFDNGTLVEVPDGCILPPSTNVLYDKNGRLMSFGGLLTNPDFSKGSPAVTVGGTRAFMLDRDIVGFMGKIESSTLRKATGNMIQSIGRSLWFVGNDLSDAVSAVELRGEASGESKVYRQIPIGGTATTIQQLVYPGEEEQVPDSGAGFIELYPPGQPLLYVNYIGSSNQVDILIRPDGGTKMKLFRATNLGLFSELVEFRDFGTSDIYHSDTEVSSGNNYLYYALAINDAGESQSEVVSVSVNTSEPPPVTPQPPTGLTAVVAAAPGTTATLYLSWSYPGDIPSGTTYTVEYSTLPSFPNNEEGETPTTFYEEDIDVTYILITGLAQDTLYYYRVKSVVGTESSGFVSGSVTTPTDTTPSFPAPTLNEITVFSNTSASLSWSWSGEDLKNFEIERKLGSEGEGFYTKIATITNTTQTTFLDTGLTASTSYDYRMRAVSTEDIASAYSTTRSVETSATAPTGLTTPTGLAVSSVTSSSITVSWVDASNNETGFELYRIRNTGETEIVTQTVASTTSPGTGTTYTLVDSGLLAANQYVYKVRSIAGSASSEYSSEVTVTTLTATLTNTEKVDLDFTITSAFNPTLNVEVKIQENYIEDYESDTDKQKELRDKLVQRCRSNATLSEYCFITPLPALVDDKWGLKVEAKKLGTIITSELTFLGKEAVNSVNTPFTADYEANLSRIPQFSKWVDGGWSNPVQVGLPEIEDDISLQSLEGPDTGFAGLVVGSRSVRVARKRIGGISIASRPSNVVTVPPEGGRLKVSIPAVPVDGSDIVDNTWLLYFTYRGLGSTATHKLFPLEIPESRLRGLDGTNTAFFGNAKYRVTKTGISDREVLVEFVDNDLLVIEPLDDAYQAEECKFIAKLGNTMCLIGTGEDETGFDVSIPNNFEGYSPEWRDWFSEVPVSIAVEQDLGFFWVMTANNIYMAEWTGVTEGSAPVVLKKVSSLNGAIGEGASVCAGGILYTLTRGKTPLVISPQGQSNGQIGAAVQFHFSRYHSDGTPYYDENTQISWDEATNSIVFSGNRVAIALQLASNTWSAPIITPQIYALLPVNGFMNCCTKSSNKFKTSLWNAYDITYPAEIPWQVVSNFKFGKSMRSLKDIIQVESIFTSPIANVPILFGAYKNFDLSSGEVLSSITVPSSSTMITVREYTENLDYDCVACSLLGVVGGQTVHTVMYTVDVHTIERQS